MIVDTTQHGNDFSKRPHETSVLSHFSDLHSNPKRERGPTAIPRFRSLKSRTWIDGRQQPPVFKPEAQAKELAGIALESSFACASGFDKQGGVRPFSDLNTEMRNFKTYASGYYR